MFESPISTSEYCSTLDNDEQLTYNAGPIKMSLVLKMCAPSVLSFSSCFFIGNVFVV